MEQKKTFEINKKYLGRIKKRKMSMDHKPTIKEGMSGLKLRNFN